jgi:hypothetical protein
MVVDNQHQFLANKTKQTSKQSKTLNKTKQNKTLNKTKQNSKQNKTKLKIGSIIYYHD